METAYAVDFILAYELEMYLGHKNGAKAYYANEVYTISCFPRASPMYIVLYSNCCVQLMVEELYVLSVLEEEEARKNALLEKFVKVAVGNSDHLQPGYDIG